jgi:hypothetical protein
VRTHGLHGGGTAHGRLGNSSSHARHLQLYGPALSSNPLAAFTPELSGEDTGSNSGQYGHTSSNTSYNSPQRQRQLHQRRQQYSTPFSSTSPGPSQRHVSQPHSDSHSPSSSPSPPCRKCRHPLTLCRVRNDENGHLDRPYYRCDRCGKFRAWADMHGVYERNPDCQCGERSRLEESNGGVWYFTCVTGRCAYYTERDWRGDAGQRGGGGYWSGSGSDRGRLEMP